MNSLILFFIIYSLTWVLDRPFFMNPTNNFHTSAFKMDQTREIKKKKKSILFSSLCHPSFHYCIFYHSKHTISFILMYAE